MATDAIEAARLEELRFAKRQQWAVAIAARRGKAMKRTLALLTLLTLLATPAQTEEDRSSGNYMLPYCKSWLRMASNDVDVIKNEIQSASTKSGGITMHFIAVGMCAGEVVGISDLLLGGSGDVKACIPSEVTNEQLVRVVVAEIENEPAFMHLNFAILAGAALKRTWPCKDR